MQSEQLSNSLLFLKEIMQDWDITNDAGIGINLPCHMRRQNKKNLLSNNVVNQTHSPGSQ